MASRQALPAGRTLIWTNPSSASRFHGATESFQGQQTERCPCTDCPHTIMSRYPFPRALSPGGLAAEVPPAPRVLTAVLLV